MAKTIVGLFDDLSTAQQVVRDLENNGFNRSDIGVIARDQARGTEYRTDTEREGTKAGEGAVAGAGTGAVLGGLAGLLVGLTALAIPGIGPIIAAGPLVTTLAGAGVGAAAGGIVGALVGAGVPEEEAHAYAEGVRRGGTLVTVTTSDEMAGQVRDIIRRYNPVDIHSRSEYWREGSWKGFDESGRPFTDEETTRERDYWSANTPTGSRFGETTGAGYGTGTMSGGRGYTGMRRDFNDYSSDFRNDFNTTYRTRGRDFGYYEPAYRYGYDLAATDRYRGRQWGDFEAEARSAWEQTHPNNPWEDVKDAVRHAWERVTGE